MSALVETLAPMRAYDAPSFEPARIKLAETAIEQALDEIVTGNVTAAGVWDLRGRVIAVQASEDLDGDGVGFAAATWHGVAGGKLTSCAFIVQN